MRNVFLFVFMAVSFFCPLKAMAQDARDGQLSTHILDIGRGLPAQGVPVSLFRADGDDWNLVTTQPTGKDGRVTGLIPASGNEGVYKLRFETDAYFKTYGQASIYPYIEVVFRIEGTGHYHIPITVTANGYSTYRGS